MEEITKVTNNMLDKIPTIVGSINDMDSRELSDREKRVFAKQAMLTRWYSKIGETTSNTITIDNISRPQYTEVQRPKGF